MKKYLAELLGTFTLTLAVLTSLALVTGVPGPLLAGLTLGLFVYTVGSISGAHLNPAITIGLWSVHKISGSEATRYILIQFLGGLIPFHNVCGTSRFTAIVPIKGNAGYFR